MVSSFNVSNCIPSSKAGETAPSDNQTSKESGASTNHRTTNQNDDVELGFDGYPKPNNQNLFLRNEETFFFGLFKRDAEYTYIANGNETINDIKAKFHLKDGALIKCNPYIVDAEWIPKEGREIYFLKNDVIKQHVVIYI